MPRFCFVAGLHRTGTSLLTRILAAHPEISAISGSPAPEDEGCYLQGAIPHTARHGIPGEYATNPEEHHIEGTRYDRLETRERMLADWSPWFDGDARWWVEKSPVNLLRMRLYQQLFPMAQFIVILRHPQVMAHALSKWTERDISALSEYGIDAYERAAADAEFLHSVLFVRYEDLVAEPEQVRRSLFAFLDLDDHDPQILLRNGNADYVCNERISTRLTERMAVWAYGPGGRVAPYDPYLRHPLKRIRNDVSLCRSGQQISLQKNCKLTSVNGPVSSVVHIANLDGRNEP